MDRPGPGLHARACALLEEWSAPDAGQDRLRVAFIHFLARGAVTTSRDHRPGHLTASTVLLDHERERVLLTLHPLAGRWFQLGGHLEAGDASVAAAAGREAAEESGIEGITLHPVPIGLDRHPTVCRDGTGRSSPSCHLDLEHVGIAPPAASATCSAESLDLAWFPLDELPDGADEVVRTLVRRVRDAGLA